MRILLKKELRPGFILPSLMAGVFISIIDIPFEISLAALIFSGSLAVHLTAGIGFILFAAMVISIVMALTSSYSSVVAIPQDSPAAILVILTLGIARSMPVGQAGTFETVMVAITLTSVLAGLFFLAMWRFKLGSLIRFVPYPVVGGFLAGTGWLLLQGAFGVMVDSPPSFSELASLFQPDRLFLWLPGLVLGLLLLLALRHSSRIWVMPVMLLAAIAIFYGFLWLTHTPISEAQAHGWLLEPFPAGSLWNPLPASALAKVYWPAIFKQLDKMGMILLISSSALLLNIGGIELEIQDDIDLNRELRSVGIANVLAGLGGGIVGYHALSLTSLAHRMGARSRLTGLSIGGVFAAVLFFGAAFISFLPKPVLGGLLAFLGLSFLVEWVIDAWKRLPRVDYLLVLVILVIIGTVGFLEGVGIGLMIALVLFVVRYSRINVVRHALSGINYHSRVDRPASQSRILSQQGEQLYILELQGFIFFGTAHNLYTKIDARLNDRSLPALRFLVLDFHRANGFDTSAVSSFIKLNHLAVNRGFNLVLTQLSKEMSRQLVRGGVFSEKELPVHSFANLDHGVEWCEDQILNSTADGAISFIGIPMADLLEQVFSQPQAVAQFMCYLDKLVVEPGYHFIHQGEESDAIYYLESGGASVLLELENGDTARLRTLRPGTMIGEVGLYGNLPRSASVVITQPSVLYRLSAMALQKMMREHSELAAGLHLYVARLLSERLAENSNLISDLMG